MQGASPAGEDYTLTLSSRLERFQNLKIQRENAQACNLEEVKKEDIGRQKNNPRLVARLARKHQKFSTIKAKRDAQKANVSYERIRSHQYSIEESDSWKDHLRRKAERKNPEYAGKYFLLFSDYGDLAKRKYDKLVANLKPDFALYRQQTPTDTIDPFTTFTPTRENVSKMVEDVYEQIEKRSTFSKKKRFNPDADVTYINERNKRFNEKISRAYGAITQELRESVEQGPYLGRINQHLHPKFGDTEE